MDDTFIEVLLLDEDALSLTFYLMFVLGAFIQSRLITVTQPMRRLPFVWSLVGISGAMTLVSLLWAFTGTAAERNILWILVIAIYACTGLVGAIAYRVNAARAVDMSGTTKGAWMGFVPILNLVLVFGRPSKARSPQPTTLTRFILHPIAVITAVAALVAIQLVDNALLTSDFLAGSESPVLDARLMQAKSVEEFLRDEAAVSQADLPMTIDEITTMVEVVATRPTLSILFDVSAPITEFTPEFRNNVVATYCGPDVYGPIVARGARIFVTYRGPDRSVIETFTMARETCSAT